MKKENSSQGLDIEIVLPDECEAKKEENRLTLKGGKGESSRVFNDPFMEVVVEGKSIKIRTKKSNKISKKTALSAQAHIKNMINGATSGHVYKLKICSSHFPMNVAVNNSKLEVKNFIGERYPRTLIIKPGAAVKVDGDIIIVEGTEIETVGTTASDIEKLTRRSNFDTRIFQDGIYIIEKDGKPIK